MFASEDEQDDRDMFDQLKCIKPFTIDQLYLLHPDVSCPPKASIISTSDEHQDNSSSHNAIFVDRDIYQHLVEHEQLRNQLVELKHDIKKLYKKTHANIDNAWTFKEETIRKIAMCQQGKIAETTFKYKQAHIDKRHLDKFSHGFNELIEKITKDYIYYSFESQTKRNKIATHLSISYQTPETETRQAKLKSAIVTLIEFIRYSGDMKSDFTIQCRKWLRTLARRYLEDGSTDNFRFIISQLARGPVGTADWSADLVECRPYEQVSGFESVPQYITHCSALLSELFYSLQMRIKQVKNSSSISQKIDENSETGPANHQKYSDQDWSLVDPRFSCTEELNVSSSCNSLLSESDVIKFCLRMPVAQIFRAYVKKCLDSSDEFRLETDKNYEYIMLKLLTIGTIIIKTYQIGLETFNSIQYGSLIEYLSSQIRRTVLILSEQWVEFKHRLKGVDDALLMRLQVEYDSFMLRSILVILELRESGIWRHLSRVEQESKTREADGGAHGWATDSLKPAFEKLLQVTGISTTQQANPMTNSPDQIAEIQPNDKHTQAFRSPSPSLTYEFSVEWFKEVSEPMLWHILWQFYHNGFMNSCDYHSGSFWLEKFQEKSVVYLFVNKIRDSLPGECSYLLNSITSMLLSRTNHDSKLVNFIAGEIFNLTFRHRSLKDKVNKKGIKSLIRCAEKFPHLISLYISLLGDSDELDDRAADLMRGCSLSGWLFDEDELATLELWLIDQPLDAPLNKVARLIISKVLLNSPTVRKNLRVDAGSQEGELFQGSSKKTRPKRRSPARENCFVDLRLRRRLALLLYRASIRHYPENNEFGAQSLGASVEVAFGTGIYCEQAGVPQNNLSELATDTTYQQFYIWTWRLLFTLRLHILNQCETDWNDVQIRSGTSRSIKNTVLINDLFHPVPSVDDAECSQLKDGLSSQNPIASFIYLILTDATWQVGTLGTCVSHLNILANSGHITPSLMAMKYLTICHLNDLLDVLSKDKKFIDYFTTIILSNFDSTRLASLIATQLDRLKHYRQLQLSHFYISVLLDVNKLINKRIASSWFSNNEVSFEKIACLLDYIVRFNFATQRLEIIRKFYECAYVLQDGGQSSRSHGWFSSLLNSNSIEKDLVTDLHLLSQKFKKFTWLQWVDTECDALRLEKIWEDIVVYLSGSEDATLDAAIKKVCPSINVNSLKSTLPIYSWIRQIFEIMECDLNHPLCPLIWYNFFLNYFANSLNGVSVGFKLISQDTVSRLLIRLDSLYNYHTYKQRNWSSSSVMQQNSLTSLYRAYKLWLQDSSLRDAYVDIDRLREDYLVPLLKAVMESSQPDVCLQYVDIQSFETQNRNLMQVWIGSTRLILSDNSHLDGSMVCFDNNDAANLTCDNSLAVDEDMMANDAISLIVRSYKNENGSKTLGGALEELARPLSEESFGEQKYQSTDELMDLVKKNFQLVFEESNLFGLNISELERTKNEIMELVQHQYSNKKREFVRVVPCIDGDKCAGPARVKHEAEEMLLDERKSQCIQDRRRQCQELVSELLLMPRNGTVQSTVIIEENIRRLISDPDRTRLVIESLLKWLSEPEHYQQLNGSYYAANHLLKSTLEILSTTGQVDTYNRELIDVCLAHRESVQVLSPYLSPSACSADCFLELYKIICSKQSDLGTTATFVLLSKFDLGFHLNSNSKCKRNHHDIIVATCAALRALGKMPDETFALTMDLFKRHLQIELASPDRRKPEELLLVLREFLSAMSDQALAPSLWLDYLTLIGLEVNMRKSKGANGNRILPGQQGDLAQLDDAIVTVENIAEDVARVAETQPIFDLETATTFLKTIGDHMKQRHGTSAITILELYQDYVEQFSLVMLSTTFIWLKTTSESHPDEHELIWKQFMFLWYDWVLLTKNCQLVGKSSYKLIAGYFVVAIRYMMYKMPRNTCAILQWVLFELTNYIVQTREVIHLELTILQRCLKSLPWSNLIASPSDIGNLAALSEQVNYNVSDLVSHIVLEMNTKESLEIIQQRESSCLPHIVERLATIIVLQSNRLKGYTLHRRYFSLIPVCDIARLAGLVLTRLELINLEHSHNNKLLMSLFRFICIDATNPSPIMRNTTRSVVKIPIAESLERAIIYAKFISDYLIDLIKRQPSIVASNKDFLNGVVNNALMDLESMLTTREITMDQKASIYASLLECCNCDSLPAETRLLLGKSVVNSQLLRTRPKLLIELIEASSICLKDSRVLVTMIDLLVDLHRSTNLHQETLGSNFKLRSVPDDLYLKTCVEERAALALIVYFESQFAQQASNGQTRNQIWSEFFNWLFKFSQSLCNMRASEQLQGSRLTAAWTQVLAMFNTDLAQYLICDAIGKAQPQEEGEEDAESAPVDERPGDENESVKSAGSSVGSVDRSPNKSRKSRPSVQQTTRAVALTDEHKHLTEFIRQLVAFYDSINTSGLWSYLKSSARSEQSSRMSVVALAIACFLTDRLLIQLDQLIGSRDTLGRRQPAGHLVLLREELTKTLRVCLIKLEAGRKSKSLLESAQFIETLVASVQQHEKVQYEEGVQLITTYAHTHLADDF